MAFEWSEKTSFPDNEDQSGQKPKLECHKYRKIRHFNSTNKKRVWPQ